MNEALRFLKYLAVMAGVTYLIRMLPLVLIKKKIRNRYFRSFLYYLPYAVLSVMTIPAVFFSVGSVIPAIAGTSVAFLLAYFEKGLLTVSAFSCVTVLLVRFIIKLF